MNPSLHPVRRLSSPGRISLLSTAFVLLLGCGSSDASTESLPVEEGGQSGAAGNSQAGSAGVAGKAGQAGAGTAGTTTAGTGGSGGGAGQAGKAGASGSGQAGSNQAGGGQAGSAQAGSGSSAAGGQAGQGGASAGGQSGEAGSGGQDPAGAGGSGPTSCPPPPACDAPPPPPGAKRPWNHSIVSAATSALGSPNHRGRDLFLRPGEDQWVIGKFAYGLNDKDIKEEEVDIYLLRDCGTTWEKLATSITTADNKHPTVEGVEDSGGRVFFRIPKEKKLGPGLHRIHMVVAGDLTTTELFLEVVEPGTPIFVSDVDGTLTTSENVEFTALLKGELPEAHVDAGKALSALAQKGYRPMYVTARPEWLTQRTREFVKERGLPPGIIHTTTTLTGNIGGGAAAYKTGEMAMLAGKGLVPSWVFGNTETDAQAYDAGKIQPINHRIFYQFTDSVYGGRRIEEYTELLPEFSLLPAVCSPLP